VILDAGCKITGCRILAKFLAPYALSLVPSILDIPLWWG